MNSAALAKVIQEHGIKSVLNLRGAASGEGWYDGEISTSRKYGVQHIDFPLSASRELSDADMDDLLDIIDRAPKPMLIHCKSGSDRTGLAGALYLYSEERRSAREAGRQLAVLYGHLPYLLWGDTAAMDRSFWRYVSEHEQPVPVIQNPTPAPGAARAPIISLAHATSSD